MSLFRDLIDGARTWHGWTLPAWFDILLRYRRTLIGPFWMVLTTGLLIACLSIIAPALFGRGRSNFIPYLASGIILWSYITHSLGDLTASFIAHSGEIQAIRKPYSTFVYRVILRNMFVLFHLLTIYVFVAIIAGLNSLAWIPLFLVGMSLCLLNFVWIGFFLGIVCARFRDFQQVINSILMVGFLITPVFWDKAALLGRRWVIDYNPLNHLLEVMRAPLLGEFPETFSYVFLSVSVVLGFALTAYLYRRFMQRVVFWL